MKLFSNLQQKDISGFLTYLWQTDPFKAKWSIIAKSYSEIRDKKGKDKVPLEKFLATICPLFDIVQPEHYLGLLGWEIAVDEEGQSILRRAFDLDLSALKPELLTTNLSVADVVQHCYTSGYVAADSSDFSNPGHEATMTMATSAQRNESMAQVSFNQSVPVPIVQSSNDNTQTLAAGHDSTVAWDNDSGQETDSILSNAGAADDSAQVASKLQENGDHNVVAEAIMLPQQANVANTTLTVESGYRFPAELSPATLQWLDGSMEPDTTAATTNQTPNPVLALANTNFATNGDWPFNGEFDPDSLSLNFDPFVGNPFNAFDMSDYVYEDTF